MRFFCRCRRCCWFSPCGFTTLQPRFTYTCTSHGDAARLTGDDDGTAAVARRRLRLRRPRDAGTYEARRQSVCERKRETRSRDYNSVRAMATVRRVYRSLFLATRRKYWFSFAGDTESDKVLRGRRVRGWLKYNAPRLDLSSPTRLVPRLARPPPTPPRFRYADWLVDGGVAIAILIGSRALVSEECRQMRATRIGVARSALSVKIDISRIRYNR